MDEKSMIVYALVARGKVVLAEYTATSGNFPTVTRQLLEKIPPRDGKMSYVYDSHVFHYLVEDEITYLCMAENTQRSRQRIPFAFLEDIKERFKSQYGAQRAKTAIAFAMNQDFSRILQKQMDYYNDNPNSDNITRVRDQLENVKEVMVQNIEKVLERGEKIELLVDKTDQMKLAARKFEKSSKRLKNAEWWRNMKMWIIIFVVVAILIFFIAAIACGGLGFDKCRAKSN